MTNENVEQIENLEAFIEQEGPFVPEDMKDAPEGAPDNYEPVEG